MGVIHLAHARGPGGFEKLVVVKVLKQELAEDPVYTAMFLGEARLAARLAHRHIVQTNEVGCEDGRYFMALELLEGGSLHQIGKKLGLRALPTNLGLRVLVAVLDALEHAHGLCDADGQALGIVHRDVSPQNVFLTFDGDVKLIDFGVAKSTDRRGAAVTQVGVVKGSIPYMSPDHVDGTAIDGRADVFAVGVILRELLVGERLWGDADDLTMLRRLIARDLPAFPGAAEVPAALRGIVLRAMAPRRDDRYASAAAMRDAVEAYLADVDPGGSLEDLGPWLGGALEEERAAFASLVRRGRARAAATTPGAPAARAHVWLPSEELMTRFSAVPGLLPAVPPPLPVKVKARPSRRRAVLAGAMFAAALALTAFGLAPRASPVAPEARVPRSAEDTAPSTLVTTLAVTEREPEPESDIAAAAAAITTDSTSTASAIPASVLHQGVPPNPYDPVE
ncbi:MAG TPA: serine/threonine-protein kinase [Labilithrix sp.]|nr:serine/threonine-protein kinase [Labilithrix sp.]